MTQGDDSSYRRMSMEPEVYWGLEREVLTCRTLLTFVVPGDPASKARARFTSRGSASRAFTPEKTRQAEERVAWAARQAGWRRPEGDMGFGLLCVFFTKGYQRRDVDNMIKLVSDGLNKIVYEDDSQITEVSGRVVRGDEHPRTHVMVYETTPQVAPWQCCAAPGCANRVKQYDSVQHRTCSRRCASVVRAVVRWTCRTCGKTENRTPGRAKIVYCNDVCRRLDPSPRVRTSRST